jgi:hypothetical protein
MEAYKAVHNTEAKEELTSIRDEISEMNLSALTDTDLDEIVESVLEEMFQKGYSVDSAHTIFSEMFVESNIDGRQAKIDRLCESLNKAFDVIDSKASTIALEEFGKYRYNKRLQESWSARFNQEKRVQRTHGQLVAQESLNVKTLLLQLVEKADKSYLETDMKKRQENNEKARKDMEKMGSKMKNPHFEEVSQIRKGWGDAYRSIYEKKLAAPDHDPVGQEDKDIDNDGDHDKTDKYLLNRRKVIGKAIDKKKKKVEEGYGTGAAMIRGGGKPKNKVDVFAYDRKIGKKTTPDGKPLPPAPTKEEYEVSMADKKGNTKAYQNYKAGMKNVKTGKPLYKAGKGVEEDFDLMFDSLIEEGYSKSEALQIMTQMALDEDSRRQEEVEQYVDFLIDEGYDCSELTWEDMFEEYESLDEGLRSAVKRLLGKKDAPVEKKPESRGEQLRKKYNVGPERSDTSAKRQILDRTRAKAERDQKQYGGSVYSKRVADKSKAAHDRYLKGGYSKYGADDARGSGNKARKRAEALRNK